MNTNIYIELSRRLRNKVSAIQHIDLYNQQYNNPQSSATFNTPAVFIEYLDARWGDDMNGTQEAIAAIRLHVVMSNSNDTANIDLLTAAQAEARLLHYDVTRQIHEAINGYAPSACTPLCRALTTYDHNHDQILVERISYAYSELDQVANRYIHYTTVTPELDIEREIVVPGS